MPQHDLLSTLAEMGIGIVGFSMVADVLRAKSPQTEAQFYTLRDVAEIGLMCAALSVFPLVLHDLGSSPESSWRVASGAALVWSILGIGLGARRRGYAGLASAIKRIWFGAILVYCLVAIGLTLAVVNLLSAEPTGARHVAWTLVALTQSGAMFILAVFDLREESAA